MSNRNKPISVMLSDDLIKGIGSFRLKHSLTTRSQAIRFLLENALNNKKNDDNVLQKEMDESIIENTKENSFREGQDDGYAQGFNDGYEHGYGEGFKVGMAEGYKDGYANANLDHAERERSKEFYERLYKSLDDMDKRIHTLPSTIKITKESALEFFKRKIKADFSETELDRLAEEMYEELMAHVEKSKE